MRVFIVEGDHPYVPGHVTSVHSTIIGAQKAALALVNMIRKDMDLAPATSWSRGVRSIRARHPEGEGDVWINRQMVRP